MSRIDTMKKNISKHLAINIILTFALIAGLVLTIRTFPVIGSHILTNSNTWSGGGTESNTACQTTSTSAIARNVHRQYAVLINTDASNSIDISLGGTATIGSGIRIGPNRSSYEINPDNQFVGAIACVSQNATATLQWMER